MSLLQSIKPFWPLLLTFILPRALSLLRTLRVAIRTRPQPTPLPAQTRTALNILFGAVAVWIVLSVKPDREVGLDNIFTTTHARLSLSTDALFARLVMARKVVGGLSAVDEEVKAKLATRAGRELYLRFGPETLVNCGFCHVDDGVSWVLYHLPKNVLLPHLVHFAVLGLVTSEGVGGWECKRWRWRVLVGAAALFLVDVYGVVGLEQKVDVNGPAPLGLFWVVRVLRPLGLCLFDAVVAGVLWASAMNRLLIFGSPGGDEETIKRRNMEMLNRSNVALQTAQTKLRAANVIRNAVVRDRALRQVEDGYWREVMEVESREGLGGGAGMEGVWEDEEVQAAMARAYGQGAIDVRRMRREAEGFVRGVTGHLDNVSNG